MSTISHYIKEIGRGSAGARSLSTEQAQDLMGLVLDGQATDLEIGAFAIAMRMKGETVDELTGFLAAVHERCVLVPSRLPVVVIPSYNGARRLPNLTPLLAMRLSQEGVRVLVHGPRQDPKRVSTADVLHDLGLPIAHSVQEVEQAWARREPAFLCIDALCPPLARLLDVRWTIGLRNSGHTVAKMIDPVRGAPALRLASYTHPEFGELMAAYARQSGATMMLLRGTEGEAVADPRRQPRIDSWIDGQPRPELGCPAQEGVLATMPLLPRTHDAATTALYIQAVMSGEKPAPDPLETQVALVMKSLAAMEGAGRVGTAA
ncbi:DNA-binding protein YbiB [Aquincola sp. MAHUQ-54]|uniref:DNA-binding protein YbiB n=1 Tax=Aquincola agrisoli TaxID=3119538 RepID=A0AAW9QHJ1_9BURK